MPHSRFDLLPNAAHFPHLEDPDGLARVLGEFLEETEPAPIDDTDWGDVIASSGPAEAGAHLITLEELSGDPHAALAVLREREPVAWVGSAGRLAA